MHMTRRVGGANFAREFLQERYSAVVVAPRRDRSPQNCFPSNCSLETCRRHTSMGVAQYTSDRLRAPLSSACVNGAQRAEFAYSKTERARGPASTVITVNIPRYKRHTSTDQCSRRWVTCVIFLFSFPIPPCACCCSFPILIQHVLERDSLSQEMGPCTKDKKDKLLFTLDATWLLFGKREHHGSCQRET